MVRQGWTAAESKLNVCPYIDLRGHTWESYLATLGSTTDASSAGEEGIDGNEPRPIDWRVENGVLGGRLDAMASSTAPSLIKYGRPLSDGERVAYQFLYEPGKTHVHPAWGRIVFLLEPTGVKLHWMTSERGEDNAVLIDPRNIADEPSSRGGPAALPLREGEWNDIELASTGGVLAIRLNGQLICERPMEPASDRHGPEPETIVPNSRPGWCVESSWRKKRTPLHISSRGRSQI